MKPRITFLGATGTVTGSRFLLETEGKKILVDCGLYQGLKTYRLRNWEPFPVPPADLSDVVLTHAHLDHCGYLPRLYAQGFRGPVRCTHATADLCAIILRDSAHLQEEDARWANKKGFSKHKPALPLYTTEDVERCLQLMQPIHYGTDCMLTDSVRLKFKDAGHILGSSFVDIKFPVGNGLRRILFSGDIGSPDRPILRDPTQVFEVDYLVLESTYGNRRHSDKQVAPQLARIISETAERRGMVIIPSFAVERTQELLFHLRALEEQQAVPVLPVYLDSPMAIEATSIFQKWKTLYDIQALMLTLDGTDIFATKNLHIIKHTEESKQLHSLRGPGIIIAGSGMLEGGRVLHHLEHRLPYPENTVLFVGYQAEGTRGRALLNGNPTIKIHGQEIPVRAHIKSIEGFSGHADWREILAWLMGFNRQPQLTFLVHGEPEASQALAAKIHDVLGWKTVIPEYLQTLSLT
ncbi:MAG: MBL fold metallo-hydrolase [Desulfobacterota bacterium]|nr:MBL fold metallo-hydrolase [Thermodesulfobacteriota bacterium]